jgi:hypothetical protein
VTTGFQWLKKQTGVEKMNKTTSTGILLGIMAVTAVALAGAPKFETLFNGKDLAGWEGVPELWKVADGQIVGTTAGHPLEANTFLIHKSVKVGDFHLKAKLKMLGECNSGIMYRAQPFDGAPFALSGPQMDIHPKPEFQGMYYSEKTGRGIVARRGQKAIVPPELNAKGKSKAKVTGTFPAEPVFNLAEWNKYEIIAVGNRLIHKINGVVTVDVIDNNPRTKPSGAIGFQLHRGPEMTIYVKDVEVRHLGGVEAAKAIEAALAAK